MSISDGLRPSIFCRKMEKRVLWGKRWKEMLFISRQSRHFHFWGYTLESTFPYLYLDLACKQLYFLPGKDIITRSESTSLELWEPFQNLILSTCVLLYWRYWSVLYHFLFPLLKTVNTNLIFPSRNYNQLFITEKHFSPRNGNPKEEETGSFKQIKLWGTS